MLTGLGRWSLALGLMFSVAACDHGDVPALRERAQQAWSEVQSLYRQRADQVLPLVEAVRRQAPAEREVLDEVMAARDEVVAILNADGFIAEPERFRHYEEAQRRLTAALGMLDEATERYPELTGDTRFVTQLAEFQRLEDRLVVARSDLISAVRAHNEELRGFPDSWIAAMLNPDAKPLTAFAQAQLERPSTHSPP
ncbi:LemA family protein [Microvirga makkahensis]|uniref:LemA family protein n=1 Tax=Microvirga makkahensis TaxID=1128670 RepID=A0A7X3MSP5_9HYPH|nr:LemA family protein [Microvirga makkahensis]MXQ12390.1 LemA family protein [Microvirga makkahensis]